MKSGPRILALSLLVLSAAAVSAEEKPALQLQKGSIARNQVVAVGRDLVVAGEALSDVAAINGTVRVSGRVAGDLIVLGGDALLEGTARVEGDVFVLGGRLETQAGARLEGRSVSYPTLSSAWMTLLEGPSLGLSPFSPVVLGAKLALLASWLTLTLLLFASSGKELLSTSQAVALEPIRSFAVGITGVIAMFLTALLFASFASALVGVPLLVLVILMALMLKLWGMAAVFHALGHWVLRSLLRRPPLPLNCAIVGLLLLGVLKVLPWVGTWSWTAATIVGVGASLTTKFGRREPWFETRSPVGMSPLA